MVTYKNIQEHIKIKYGFYVNTCWIADVKEMCGLPLKVAPNRINPRIRIKPCPSGKIDSIKQAFRYYGMIK